MPRGLSVAVAVVATLVVPGVAAAGPPETVRWGPCPEDVTAPGLECATLDVPLDYRDPGGERIEIAISRLAGKNPAKRRGVLFTNPGGPGGAALGYPATIGLPQEVLDSYDVIGMDPRGVGHSTPVTCDLTTEQQEQGNLPPYANSAADVVARAAEVEAVARQCTTSETAPLLPYITTANTARDMDLIREALGEPTLSYVGYSYGTYLGSVYATLFPRRGDRIVLDSNLPATGLDRTGARLMARGFEDRFPDFAAFAAARPEYGLGTTQAAVTAKYSELAERLDAKPIGLFDGAMFRFTTFALLYKDAILPQLATLWQALDAGGPVPDWADGPLPANAENALSSHLHVICGDAYWPRSVRGYQRDVAVDRVRYPLYGAAAANIRACAYWPTPVERPVEVGGRGPANVLLVQNERDPGTPLAGARDLRRAFGDRARMVTVDAGGHGAYLIAGNRCADETVTAYLTGGERPAHDLHCAEPFRAD